MPNKIGKTRKIKGHPTKKYKPLKEWMRVVGRKIRKSRIKQRKANARKTVH